MPSHILPLSNILTRQVDSAMIVHREGVCLGIKTSGDLFFPLREMTVRVDEAREAVIFELEVYFSSDLMAHGAEVPRGTSKPLLVAARGCRGERRRRRRWTSRSMKSPFVKQLLVMPRRSPSRKTEFLLSLSCHGTSATSFLRTYISSWAL